MKAGCFTDKPPILCVIPYSTSDFQITAQLLEWIKELGGCPNNGCLLVADCKVPLEGQQQVLNLANEAFKSAASFSTPQSLPDEKWPRGANYLFHTAAKIVETKCNVPFWWNEPDCIPLTPNWLEYLEHDYYRAGKPFMGFVLPQVTVDGKKVGPCVNGCAVYPADTLERFKALDFYGPEAWDILASPIMLPQTHPSTLIQHFWGEMGLAPTFRTYHEKGETRNVFTFDQISKSAVVFHRNKDGTLVHLLRSRTEEQATSVFHSGDLGDIIYGLLFASQLGKIKLFLGPDPKLFLRAQMTPETFAWLKPLFDRQDWIIKSEFRSTVPSVQYNLNDFRQTWFSGRKRSTTLFAAYAEHFRAPPLREDIPWLKADPEYNKQYPIVIARSPRYRSPDFPWQMVSGYYAGRMQFIGHEDEYREWVASYGKTAVHRPVKNALDMANVIAGSELFIGNQSFPMALALALNVRVVQEVCPRTPDCVFRRPNATYVTGKTVQLPRIQGRGVRYVENKRNASGEIELGPCADATGLGDTLSILPVAEALKNAVMLLPNSIKHYAFLFKGICPTRVTDAAPEFRFEGGKCVSQAKLDFFGIRGVDPIPRLKINWLDRSKVVPQLNGFENPIAFCPTCSKAWEHIRQRPPSFWAPIIGQLAQRYTVLQFGRDDYELVPGAVRAPWLDLPDLAAIYSLILKYVGCDTGDHHLMLAVGGRAVVADPPATVGFDPRSWQYNSPSRVAYASLDDPNSVLEAARKLQFL